MAEFIRTEEKVVNVSEPVIFENNTDSDISVSAAIVFRKSGLYDVSIVGRRTIISKVAERKGEPMSRLETEDFATLAICAIRYCQGRQTYMPGLVMDIVRPHLKELSDKDLTVMIEDCDFQERMHLYGDERIDKPGWLKWKADLIAERERRTNG